MYDVGGRFVSIVFDGSLKPGAHYLTWDGRNAYGHPVAAGIYIIRISSPEASATGRFVMVR